MKKLTALLALVAALSLALTACGSSDTGSDSAGSVTHDSADVTFAQQMIPHHEQAVAMARLAQGRAGRPEVRKLAADIEAAQGPEIRTMRGWLDSWGEAAPSADGSGTGGMSGMDGMDHVGHGSGRMPGMMSSASMHRLARMHGGDFDRMFLTMMIRHHQGALVMARTEQAHGQDPDAIALAKKIERTQSAQIATMRQMLG